MFVVIVLVVVLDAVVPVRVLVCELSVLVVVVFSLFLFAGWLLFVARSRPLLLPRPWWRRTFAPRRRLTTLHTLLLIVSPGEFHSVLMRFRLGILLE